MSYKGSPREISEEVAQFGRNLQRNLKDAEKANLVHAQRVAQGYSMGPYSLARLARMGYPYSRRNPDPPFDAAIINMHEEVFLRGFRRKLGRWTGGRLVSMVTNITQEWQWLKHGTRLMIARPVGALVARHIRDARLTRLKRAVRDTTRP